MYFIISKLGIIWSYEKHFKIMENLFAKCFVVDPSPEAEADTEFCMITYQDCNLLYYTNVGASCATHCPSTWTCAIHSRSALGPALGVLFTASVFKLSDDKRTK